MKPNFIFTITGIIFCISCITGEFVYSENPVKNTPFVIDLTKQYPESKLSWQEIANIEYVALETSDAALVDKNNRIIVSESNIIVCNLSLGDIMVFDKKGKIRSNFNHKGGSGEEYTGISKITYDENKHEIYVLDAMKKNILFYTEDGQFKRKIKIPQNSWFDVFYVFDDNSFLVRNTSIYNIKNKDGHDYLIISKTDGSIVSHLPIKLSRTIPKTFFRQSNGMTSSSTFWMAETIIKDGQDYIISDISSDTVFLINKNSKLRPFLVRKPGVFETNIPILLNTCGKTDKYLFFWKINYDYKAGSLEKITEKLNKLKTEELCLDLEKNKLFKPEFYNADYPESNHFTGMYHFLSAETYLKNMAACFVEAETLIKAKKNGKLNGKLKQLSTKLHDDDNPVLMILRFK